MSDPLTLQDDGQILGRTEIVNASSVVVNPATEETVSQLVMAITNALNFTAYDLNAAAFSEVTSIANDYEFDSIELNFSTAEAKTITITSSDGTILWGGDVDQTAANQGYLTTAKHFYLGFNHRGFDGGDNITVAVTQFASPGTMDCVLRTKSGTNSLLGNPTVKQGDNYFGEVALGNIVGRSVVNKFGHTENVTTSLTDIWNDGGLYTFPPSASVMTISSVSTNDNIAGTGARTVEIEGLDTNYSPISETLEMDGQDGVTSDKSYLRVFRMKVITAGAIGWNEGNIYFGTGGVVDGVPANIYAEIVKDPNVSEGENQTLMAIYTVPAGKKGLIWNLNVATSLDKPVEIWLKIRPFGEVFQTKIRTAIIKNKHLIPKKFPIEVTGKSDIRISAQTDSQTTDLSASFDIELVDI